MKKEEKEEDFEKKFSNCSYVLVQKSSLKILHWARHRRSQDF